MLLGMLGAIGNGVTQPVVLVVFGDLIDGMGSSSAVGGDVLETEEGLQDRGSTLQKTDKACWKITILSRRYIFKWWLFHCYLSCQWCIWTKNEISCRGDPAEGLYRIPSRASKAFQILQVDVFRRRPEMSLMHVVFVNVFSHGEE